MLGKQFLAPQLVTPTITFISSIVEISGPPESPLQAPDHTFSAGIFLPAEIMVVGLKYFPKVFVAEASCTERFDVLNKSARFLF